MHNVDLDQQLQQLADGIVALRGDLQRSDDMLPMPLAVALVKAAKVNHDFAALADKTRKGLAPLFGKDGGGEKPRRRK